MLGACLLLGGLRYHVQVLGHATEAVAAKTGDAVGGLLNATLGNLTELIIAITALHAGQYMLVKASIAGVSELQLRLKGSPRW